MRILALPFMILLGLSALTAGPLPVGSARFVFSAPYPITVFTYKPAGFDHGPLLVVCHGVNRDAEEYRNHAIAMAEKFKAIVVAPRFDAGRFKSERYQRGGVLRNGRPQPRDQWTYAIVHRLVAQVRAKEGRPDMPCSLIGHSAGGQFLARMAAFDPGDVCRIVVSNPSSCLFPTRAIPFGYGFGNLPPELSSDQVMRAYLASPLTFYLGTGDTVSDANFDASPAAMRQGMSRLARGRACYEMGRKLAAKRGWTFNWRKVEIQGVGHCAPRMFAANQAGNALFGTTRQSHRLRLHHPVRAAPLHARRHRPTPRRPV